MRLSTLSESEIIITLIALALLLLSAFVFGTLTELIKGPRVVGEIIGGMVIGGSFLFIIAPALSERIFFAYPEEGKVLNIFYQLGLIFLMFLSGYNTDIKVDKSNAKTISLVFIGATFLPMAPAAFVRSEDEHETELRDHYERTRRSGDRSCDRGLLI